MYNFLFGTNNAAAISVFLTRVSPKGIQRFRDAIIKKDEEHGYVVEILTRTGGVNRENFLNTALIESSNYLKDYDDDYDGTYAHFIFKVDDMYSDVDLESIVEKQSRKSLNLKEMFEQHFKEMEVEGTEANKKANEVATGLVAILNQTEKSPKSTKLKGNKINFITIDDIIAAGKKGD